MATIGNVSAKVDREGVVSSGSGGGPAVVEHSVKPNSRSGAEIWWTRFVGQGSRQRLPWRKRAFDVLLGAVLSLITLPLVIVLAVGSAVTFREWPIFSHFRVGRFGDLFRFLKIRSMPSSAPRYADKYALRDVEIGRWGKLLRGTHLDELPQLWLVLAGKMSLVGPRPEMPELLMSFDHDFVEQRLTVPQGCTGLWQVSSSAAGLIGEGPEWDRYYLRNWTLRLDCWILWRTLLAAAGHSVSSLEGVPSWCLSNGQQRGPSRTAG